ncbi:Hint domain-containing protein [Cognatiyoonia sp. IB215182]|uniref:Hint domain-containing protein n=1 Tax=Cognatiyoonia sp. IB215182 TaxID=3097353 RepID=UPI002A16DBBB|nr:Hint domain-containing protein [Cognatiyoonia sp. IB215182]MDX8352818.1 Hint domain-containing protein [Cognatiyoonia sp. IB215182]
MPILENGDFSDGLNGWTVVGAGPTAPTFDAANGWVVFGAGNNDVQDGDRLQQQVSLEQGTEYTLSFTMQEVGDGFGGFGLNIDLIELNPDGSQGNQTSLGFEFVFNAQTNNVSITFVSPYDDAILQIRGGFGFGAVSSTLVLDDFVLTCFGRGTMIMTPTGAVTVERLQAGDLVNTLDDGPCPLRWVGSRVVEPAEINQRPEWTPVVVTAGALGRGRPNADLILSPCHRVLISDAKADLLFGVGEALVPAKFLVGQLDGVRNASVDGSVCYYHLLFDAHQIVTSNGLCTESFHPAQRTISKFDRAARREVLSLFPDLSKLPTARRVLKRYEADVLLSAT